MAKKGINLITQTGRERASFLKIKLKVKKYLVFLGIIFLLSGGATAGVYFYASGIVKSNKAQIESLKKEILTFSKNESYLITIANRIKGLDLVFKSRKNYAEILTNVSSLYVPGFKLSNLEISSAGAIKLDGTCDDISSVINFNERVEEVKDKKIFKEIVYNSVSRSLKGAYGISMEFKK